jgi:hypothetical protein
MLSRLAKVELITGAARGTLKVKLFTLEVTGLKPSLPALTAVTAQVAAVVALNELPLREQPAPVTWKVNSPVPDPPDVVSEIGVPVKPVSTELATESGAWSASANTNVLAADVAALNPLLAAFTAVTTQFVTVAATRAVPVITQSAPLTVKLTSPVPEPPAVARDKVVPGRFRNVVLMIKRVAWL